VRMSNEQEKWKRQDVENFKAQMIKELSSMFDSLQFDENGYLVSRFNLERRLDHLKLMGNNELVGFVVTNNVFSFTIEPTLDQLAERIEAERRRIAETKERGRDQR